MKKLLPWLKANLISVIAVTLAIVAAPVMLFFSHRWTNTVRTGVENEVSQNLQQLQGLDVTYSIKPYLAGQAAVDVKAAPNKATIDAVSNLLSTVVKESGEVYAKAVEFNSKGYELLISGTTPGESLFPDQPDESTRLRLLSKMVEVWPKAHQELLALHKAGEPPSPQSVIGALEALKAKEVDRRTTGRGEAALTAEDAEQVKELLSSTRLELYRRRANELSFYAPANPFSAVQTWEAQKLLPIETAWDWQFLYWVHSAVTAGVAEANKDPVTGLWQPVYRAPVKVLESVGVYKPGQRAQGDRDTAGGSSSDASSAGGAPAGAGPGPDETAEIPPDFKVSHTGRVAAPVAPNGMYDVRYADVTLVCASRDLPRVLTAFSRVNFMTVVGVKAQTVETLPLLESGMDTGPDHLVRATIRVETIWLRAWTRQYMPKAVRASLGIPEDPAPSTSSDGQAPPQQG